MRPIDDIFRALSASPFRRRFHLKPADLAYVETKTLPVVLDHARDFIEKRLAPENPRNDGKQTPFRGHPVFIAQHATATCCRGCLAKLHGIAPGRALTREELAHILAVIERWLAAELTRQERTGDQ